MHKTVTEGLIALEPEGKEFQSEEQQVTETQRVKELGMFKG